jgi:uncharacterized protein YkwD
MEVGISRQARPRAVVAAAAGAVVLATALLLVPGAPSASAGAGCANAGAEPGEATLRQLKRAVICLVNNKRSSRGKPRLDRNGKLSEAATNHTEKMLAQDCFEHKCAGEPGFGRRVRRSGYPDGADRWKARENLGYAPTPRKMVRAFMNKDASRLNILNENFRDVGIGAGQGVPVEGKPEDKVTYTLVLAWRRG